MLSPWPVYNSVLRIRVKEEARGAGFWSWLVPSPRLAFAATALLIASIWLSSFQPPRLPSTHTQAGASIQNTEAEFGMIKDLPMLEDYDVLTSFDALSELPAQPSALPQHPM
jgi:hypothetical protein